MRESLDFPPGIAFSKQKDSVSGSRSLSSDVLSIEPIVPFLKELFAHVELWKLREGKQTHQQRVSEDPVHALKLAPGSWVFTLLFFLLFAETIHCEDAFGLVGSLPIFWQGRDDLLRSKVANLSPSEQYLNCLLRY